MHKIIIMAFFRFWVSLYVNKIQKTLQNKNIIDLIQDDKMLKKFYTSLYLQIAAAQYEYTLFIRGISNMYNLDISNMCICDKKVYTITHNNVCTKE